MLGVGEELRNAETYLVVAVKVLGVPVAELDPSFRVLGELVNDKTHLKTCIAGEGVVFRHSR